MLFLANVTQAQIHYKDLTDLSLRIIPYVTRRPSVQRIGEVDMEDYEDTNIESPKTHIFNYEYYNTKNIYYNVGYWNEEYYRLGIVYIYEDGSLSNVYNVSGGTVDFTGNE